MKKILLMVVFGLLVGAITGGLTWTLVAQQRQSMDEASPERPSVPGTPSSAEESHDDDQLPVAEHPGPVSVEELVKVAYGLKEQKKSILESQEQLQKAKMQQQLVLADIEVEQKEFDGLLEQAKDQQQATAELLQLTEAALAAMKAENDKRAAQAKESEVGQAEATNRQAQNITKTATLLQNMDPAKAAADLKSLANDGDMALVIQVLTKMEERIAGEILAAIDDDVLRTEILREFTQFNNPLSPKKSP